MTSGFMIRRVLSVITLFASVSVATTAQGAAPDPGDRIVIHQLRIYEIFEGNKRRFHDRFRDHAMRIMARYDFEIVAMWEARGEDRTEFVYLLEWPDETTMKDRWAKFMADEEWSEIKRVTGARHGRLVGEIADRMLKVTDYSPRRALTR